MHFAERIARKLASFGEQFTVSGTTHLGIFKILDSGTMNVYLDDVERMGVVHPALLLVTAPDVPIETDDTLTRDGRTYTVLKTSLHRIGDTAVVKIIILS
jgi:hypothetical protein